MDVALRRLRSQAARHTLFGAASLKHALTLLPFVQADPIRAPARAQDLILRQRVDGYRVGDLERAYPDLDLEEGFLYAYGFLPRLIWQIRHPPNMVRLTALEKKILARVAEVGLVHPEALRAELGTRTAVNGWGGQSTRVKLALESLHRRGLLRVARRRNGIRMYALCPPLEDPPSPQQIFELVAATVVRVLAPALEPGVRSIMARLSRRIPGIRSPATELAALVARGLFERREVSGAVYLDLGEAQRELDGRGASPPPVPDAPERRVRFLAPFDPLVWDRKRFEHFWGWSYRFEAYTPLKKRVRGYYAMPLAHGDDVIGWANITASEGELDVDLGFVGARPRGRSFRAELDAEVERLRAFLVPPAGALPERLDADDAPLPEDAARLGKPSARGRARTPGAPPATASTPRKPSKPAKAARKRVPPPRGRPKQPGALEAAALRETRAPESSRPRANRQSRRRPS